MTLSLPKAFMAAILLQLASAVALPAMTALPAAFAPRQERCITDIQFDDYDFSTVYETTITQTSGVQRIARDVTSTTTVPYTFTSTPTTYVYTPFDQGTFTVRPTQWITQDRSNTLSLTSYLTTSTWKPSSMCPADKTHYVSQPGTSTVTITRPSTTVTVPSSTEYYDVATRTSFTTTTLPVSTFTGGSGSFGATTTAPTTTMIWLGTHTAFHYDISTYYAWGCQTAC